MVPMERQKKEIRYDRMAMLVESEDMQFFLIPTMEAERDSDQEENSDRQYFRHNIDNKIRWGGKMSEFSVDAKGLFAVSYTHLTLPTIA